jgi:hypothetical protein
MGKLYKRRFKNLNNWTKYNQEKVKWKEVVE